LLEFRETSIYSPDAQLLVGELNEVLIGIIGNNGAKHVQPDDFGKPGAVFLVGYEAGMPMCCAGIRRFDDRTGEVKRVYARKNHNGNAAALMQQLEIWAREHGCSRLILECRQINQHAISFYRKNGYSECPKYPPYEDQGDAVCLEKQQ